MSVRIISTYPPSWRAARRGKHVAKQLPLAAFFSPDDDVLPVVEDLACLIPQFVLTNFGGRRATTEEINES